MFIGTNVPAWIRVTGVWLVLSCRVQKPPLVVFIYFSECSAPQGNSITFLHAKQYYLLEPRAVYIFEGEPPLQGLLLWSSLYGKVFCRVKALVVCEWAFVELSVMGTPFPVSYGSWKAWMVKGDCIVICVVSGKHCCFRQYNFCLLLSMWLYMTVVFRFA